MRWEELTRSPTTRSPAETLPSRIHGRSEEEHTQARPSVSGRERHKGRSRQTAPSSLRSACDVRQCLTRGTALGPGTRFDADGVQIDEDADTHTTTQEEQTRAHVSRHRAVRQRRSSPEITSPWTKQQCDAWSPRPLHRPWQMQMHEERESERPRGQDNSWEERRGHSKACAMPPSSAARRTCGCGCVNSMHMPTHRAGQMMTDCRALRLVLTDAAGRWLWGQDAERADMRPLTLDETGHEADQSASGAY